MGQYQIVSFGVVIARHRRGRGGSRGGVEVLLVKRRYTYAFFDFVLGRYRRDTFYRDSTARQLEAVARQLEAVARLLGRMTVQELSLIDTADFDRMWSHAFVSEDPKRRSPQYFRALKKFVSLTADGPANLRLLVARAVAAMSSSSRTPDPLWELPKGRPNSFESPVLCAIRETEEEALVPKSCYRLMGSPLLRIRDAYKSNGMAFAATYYIGACESSTANYARADICIESGEYPGACSSEVVGRQWATVAESIRMGGNISPHTLRVVKRAVNKFVRHTDR